MLQKSTGATSLEHPWETQSAAMEHEEPGEALGFQRAGAVLIAVGKDLVEEAVSHLHSPDATPGRGRRNGNNLYSMAVFF